MKIKMLKDPQKMIFTESVYNYIVMLEDTGKLDMLPKNLFVYYVLFTLTNEVNNGGYDQYLSNSSKNTYRYLRKCAEYLDHEVLTPYIFEVCDFIDSSMPCDITEITDDAFFDRLSEFDNKFYDIDKKFDVFNLITNYYQANIEFEKIDVPKLREKESDLCRYFTVPKEMSRISAEEATESFLKILADYSEHRWIVELLQIFDGYKIKAHAIKKSIDLAEAVAKWGEEVSFSEAGCADFGDRIKVSSYFKEIGIFSSEDGQFTDVVWVRPSGYERREYKIKYGKHSGGMKTGIPEGAIMSGELSYKKDPERYNKIKEILESKYREYPNIESFVESGYGK